MARVRRAPVLRYLLLALLAAVVGLNVYALNAERLAGNRLPMPFGYGAAVVLSGSMEPELSTGDLVIVGDGGPVEVGDVVVYQDGNLLVVHRVVETEGGVMVTKGDANNVADEPVAVSAVRGEVLASIPFLGTVVSWLKSPVGTVLVLAAAVMLLEAPRWAERRREEEERRAVLAEIERLKRELRR
ncbi:MAG: signal peptidase I [Eggerthellaceae bacterium]|nr:signal peptidase I [Eggerthellaceae bacterium]